MTSITRNKSLTGSQLKALGALVTGHDFGHINIRKPTVTILMRRGLICRDEDGKLSVTDRGRLTYALENVW